MNKIEMYSEALKEAEADLKKANMNVELRQADVDRAQAACADAREQQAKIQGTCDWLRERLRDQPDEEAAVASAPRLASLPATPAAKSVPGLTAPSASHGMLFGKPMPEVTNTGLCLRALEQLGKPSTTKEVREQIERDGHKLDQGQVRGTLKYLAGRKDAQVENPESGVWVFRPTSEAA